MGELEIGIVNIMTASITPLLEQLKAAVLEQHPDKLLTKQEAADLLGVTTETVANYIKANKLTPYYHGTQKSPLFRRGDLYGFLRVKK
jgi:excisionase family DNA binding protein